MLGAESNGGATGGDLGMAFETYESFYGMSEPVPIGNSVLTETVAVTGSACYRPEPLSLLKT